LCYKNSNLSRWSFRKINSYLIRYGIPHRGISEKSNASLLQDWRFFGRICGDYVQESDREINDLYNFLSASIDSMDAKAKEQRQKELMISIQDDINSAYGDEEEAGANSDM